jgi:hypothetical protein
MRRYNATLDRLLCAVTLLREGDPKASATIIAQVLGSPELEDDLEYLNRLQASLSSADASFIEDEEVNNDSHGNSGASAIAPTVNASDEPDGWGDVDGPDGDNAPSGSSGSVDPEHAHVGEGNFIDRRTAMMLRNLKRLRELEA